MNSKIRIIVTVGASIALVCVFALLHEATRTKVPEHMMEVDDGGNTCYVDVDELTLTTVCGQVVNGKGKIKDVEGQGILLRDVLSTCHVRDYLTIRVISDDEYAAELSKEEVENSDIAYLLIEGGEARLYVFGDSNSKRNVANVKRICIKQPASAQ